MTDKQFELSSSRKYCCPSCGEKSGVNIEYGMPGIDMAEAAERGEVVLGGCCIDENSPERKCLECGHEWLIKRRKLGLPDAFA